VTPRALATVPLAAALLPAVTIHLCYLIAAAHGHIPWCVPYWLDCVSISATGRQSPEAFVFRALMIPTAVLFMLYWLLCHAWLRALGGARAMRRHLMLALGVTGAVGLILYTTVLGAEGQVFFFQRRAGVTSFYIMTVLAQCLLTLEVLAIARRRSTGVTGAVRLSMATLAAFVVAAGLASLVLSAAVPAFDRVEDAFEWAITLFILAHALATHVAWRQCGFSARFAVASGPGEDPVDRL